MRHGTHLSQSFRKRLCRNLAMAAMGAAAVAAFSPASNAQPTPSSGAEFSVIAANDPLLKHLQTVRRADWSNLDSTPAPGATESQSALTRYEVALETTKALIAVRARHNADVNWSRNTAPEPLRALRALCVALSPEMARFDVPALQTVKLLDELIARSQQSTRASATDVASTPNPAREAGAASREGAADAGTADLQPLVLRDSLSQRLRVYSALDSLVRESHDPLRKPRRPLNIFDARPVNTIDYASSSGIKKLRAGTELEVTESLQLRAQYDRSNSDGNEGFREFLSGAPSLAAGRKLQSIGAGADWTLLPGVVLSGGVSQVDSDDPFADGVRYEGALGLTGWQNRVALSAHLSRLVPEDSQALGATAARFNLGLEVTSQVQLKLMYQQLFGGTNQGASTRRFGGGIDFSF